MFKNRVGTTKRSIVGWESVGARGTERLRFSATRAAGLVHSVAVVSVNIFICSSSHLTIADGSIGLNWNLSRAIFFLIEFNHMNYSRRVAIWLLALSVQIIQACAYCGRLEMISVWLLFLKLLVGIKIMKLCASVASVCFGEHLHAQGTTSERFRNSVCCICTVVLVRVSSVFKKSYDDAVCIRNLYDWSV